MTTAYPQPAPASAGKIAISGPVSGVRGMWMLWIIPLIAFANAAAYIAFAGNPLVASDAWYFIHAFLERAMDTGPALQDFFVKRDGSDHAQPLIKLLMWINAEWFGLDFVLEALIGLGFAALTFVVLARSLEPARVDGVAILGTGALALALVTMNAGMVFNWSLVTMTYLPYFLAVLAYASAWRVLDTGRGSACLLAVAFVVAFTMDDVGIIVSLSVVLSSIAATIRSRQWSRAAKVVAAVVVAEICYFAFARVFLPGSQAVVEDQLGATGIAALLARVSDAPEVARIVFGSTLAHIHTLAHYFGGNAARWQGVLAALAASAHIWFWWRAWRSPWTSAVFHAVSIMLLFYGMIAGIIISRLPGYGVNYLHEPRYAVFYLLSNVALILMLIGSEPGAQEAGRRGPRRVFAPMVLMFVAALQLPLSWFTWRDGAYLHTYYHTMASQMYALGAGREAASCVPLLTVCQMPKAERERIFSLLERHRLNVYSPAFVERYRLRKLAPAD